MSHAEAELPVAVRPRWFTGFEAVPRMLTETAGTVQEITCVVADDHPPILAAVSLYLEEEHIPVVGTATTGAEALAMVAERRPTIAVLDLRMPSGGVHDVVRSAVRSAPDTRVVVYTGFATNAALSEALDAGAHGVVVKDAPLADLGRAIRMIAAGGTYVDPAFSSTTEMPLTQRERDVLRLIADGYSNDEIGKTLFIAGETVRTHLRKAMSKLGVRTRAGAVGEAFRRALIS